SNRPPPPNRHRRKSPSPKTRRGGADIGKSTARSARPRASGLNGFDKNHIPPPERPASCSAAAETLLYKGSGHDQPEMASGNPVPEDRQDALYQTRDKIDSPYPVRT